MSMKYRDKHGTLHKVSVLDLLTNGGKTRASLDAARKKRDEATGKASSSLEEVKSDDQLAATNSNRAVTEADLAAVFAEALQNGELVPAETVAEDDIEALDKEQQAIQARLKEIKQRKGELWKAKQVKSVGGDGKENKDSGKKEKQSNPEQKNPGQSKKEKNKKGEKQHKQKPERGAAIENNYEDHSDTDPNVLEGKAQPDEYEGYEASTPPPDLNLYQCAQIMRLYDYYDQLKYLAIASRFYDLSKIQVHPAEMKKLIQEGYIGGNTNGGKNI